MDKSGKSKALGLSPPHKYGTPIYLFISLVTLFLLDIISLY